MPGATREGADTAGGVLTSGARTVIINSCPAVRIGDSVAGHGLPPHSAPTMATGSPTVITEKSPQSHEGDIATCGHAATGSPNVFVGDQSFSVNVQLEEGVTLVGNNTVYADTPGGHAAQKRDEANFDPALPGHAEEGATEATPPIPPPGESVECGQFSAVITDADMAKKISSNFLLATCKMKPQAQLGLTASQIACNWVALSNVILEPIYANFKFGTANQRCNSGLRTLQYNTSIGSKDSSDHCRGFAADIAMGSMAQTRAMFKWILNSGLPFSQLIFENTWVHVAYNGKVHNDIYKIAYLAGGIHPGGFKGELLPASITA